jgi:deazaflavin-dependent oxidoreductase (nitroreductase family)
MTTRLRPLSRAPYFIRLANHLIQAVLRMGVPLGPMILLTVIGRKSGEPRTTPVGLFELDGRRYLFSTFGEVNWVHNLRAAGQGLLTHGHSREPVGAVELPPEAAAPILHEVFAPYLASLVTRPMLQAWYGVSPDSSSSDLITVARRHPVFELHGSMPAA